MIGQFLSSKRGNVALSVGILALPLLMCGGVAIDYSSHYSASSALQNAADAAALASARELGLTSTKDENVKAIAKNYVLAGLAETRGQARDTSAISIKTDISSSRKDVTVNVSFTWAPMFLHLIDSSVLPIKVKATASLAGDESICVLALDSINPSSLAMTGQSTLTANDCAVHSNSGASKGVNVVSGANLSSISTYSSGGFGGPLGSYSPQPITDSPAISDPLEDRTPPSYSGCDHNNYSVSSGELKLTPGVYCGGISTKGKATLNLDPGVYIIKDGPLSISGNSTITGDNVGFYFEGDTAVYDFGVSTQVSLSAPTSGLMAGILFYESRNSPADRDFVIRSKDAEKFEGTVYLPRGRFVVDKASRVGHLSSWTAIIAKQIEVKQGPNLQINADYAGSDIPVPNGIGASGTPRLSR